MGLCTVLTQVLEPESSSQAPAGGDYKVPILKQSFAHPGIQQRLYVTGSYGPPSPGVYVRVGGFRGHSSTLR